MKMMEFYKEEQLFVDALPIGAFVFTSSEHTIIAANKIMLRMLEWEGCFIGKSATKVFPWFGDRNFVEQLDQIYSNHQNEVTEYKVKLTGIEGCPLYLSCSLKPRLNKDGEIYAVLVTAINITNYVLSEEKLRQAEHRQAFLLKLSDTLRPLGDPAEIQKEAARILGEYLHTSRVGYGDVDKQEQRWFRTENNWTDGTVPHHHGTHDLAGFGPDVLEALRTGVSLVIDDMLEDPRTASPEMQAAFTALQFRAALTVSLLKNNRFVAAMYVHDRNPREWTEHEISLTYEVAERTWAAVQRAFAEQTLRESEDKFRTLFNTIDEGFCILEIVYNEENEPVDLLYLLTNDVFERQTGIKDAEGKTLKGFISEAEQFWIDAYSKVAETGQPIRFENYSKAFNRWFNVYASRVGDGSVKQVALVFDDITERKQQEQRKNDFISMVSHELKTPLTTLKAHLQLVERKAKQLDEPVIQSSIGKSLFQVDRMQKLIQGFLDVARLEEGKIYLNLSDFDLCELVSESLEDFCILDDSHQFIYKPSGPVAVKGDRDKIGQVINNLVSNAVKYSPKGSTVEIRCEKEDKVVKISVRDEGIGVKPENVGKLFDRFFRVEDHDIKHISGFGIGLYLCSEIVKYHQGEIGVDSSERQGSCFWFKLPLLEKNVVEI